MVIGVRTLVDIVPRFLMYFLPPFSGFVLRQQVLLKCCYTWHIYQTARGPKMCSRQGQTIFLFSTGYKLTVGPTQCPIQCIPRAFSPRVKPTSHLHLKKKLNSVALVRTRTIPTERPPPVGEVSANFCG